MKEHQNIEWNPGQLPEHWTLDKLMDKHPSNPFNPLVAAAFFRAGYVESWGRGIEKIRRECVAHDALAPIFDTSMSGLMLTFKANPTHVKAALGEVMVKTPVEKFGEKFGETSASILQALRNDPHMTAARIADTLGLTVRAVEKSIRQLKSDGHVERHGPAKGGHWEVLK